MMPAPVLVVHVTIAVMRGDWMLVRHLHREAVLARVAALLDDGLDVAVPDRRKLDADERPLGRLVGFERGARP
jgi:hypothetical protein